MEAIKMQNKLSLDSDDFFDRLADGDREAIDLDRQYQEYITEEYYKPTYE
jgi:hypothetical protein